MIKKINREFFRKNKKVLIWSSTVFVVLILALYIYLRISATLHFNLQTELLTTHTPAQLIVKTTNGETVDIELKTDVSTFRACDSICQYEVPGIYQLENQSSTKLTHKFTLSTPARGFGQQLYYFRSSCKTIPSTFCPSSQKAINQTSLIVVDYSLNTAEQKIIEDLENIRSDLDFATETVKQMRYAKQLYSLWPAQDVKIPDDKPLSDLLTSFTKTWRAQEFILASKLLENISSLTTENVTSVTQLLEQIQEYNQLQSRIAQFLSNETVREFVIYSQNYGSNSGTVRQAVGRLVTITSQNFIQDLARSQQITNGAIAFLENETEIYSESKETALQTIELARRLLPLIETPLSNVSLDLCNATDAIRSHNAWATSSNFTIISEEDAQTIVQKVNATYVFNIPVLFCVENQISVPISLPTVTELKYNYIKVVSPVNLSSPQIELPKPQCSVGSQMKNCTQSKAPIVFIHGHAFDESNSPQISMTAFGQLQERLENDGYVNAGELDTESNEIIMQPFTMRASYYYIKQIGVGSYEFEIQKSERIENYAIRLKEIIDDVKAQSGSSNVTLIAHSMGGLVAREYANLFGMESVDRVITINTPHQGVTGRTASICNLIGAAKECEDMTANSTFLRRLPPITGQWDVIASTGCQMKDGVGDGVVLVGNSLLPGSTYNLLNGTCTDALKSDLHTSALNDDRVYELIVQILENN